MGVVPSEPVPSVPPGDSGAVRYAEVLRVPLRWWALSTTFHATALLAFVVALPLGVALAAVGSMAALTTVWFLSYGRARVVVTDTTFQAGRAQIPVSFLADPRPLTGEETWRAAGPGADARAYLLLRPYLREAVMVQVVDPADPVPYWLVSSRRAPQLAAALGDTVTAATRGEARGPGVSEEGHRAQ